MNDKYSNPTNQISSIIILYTVFLLKIRHENNNITFKLASPNF